MIIGLCGKRSSGKNLVAEYCMKSNIKRFYQFAFAEPIKEICESVFDLHPEQYNGKLKHVIDDRYGKTPRKIMQEIGDAFRSINKNIFISILQRKIEIMVTNKDIEIVVIPDVRFINEAEWIRSQGGILGLVSREIERNFDTDQHISECELDNWSIPNYDYVIKNPTPQDKNGLRKETEKMLQYFGLV